MEKRGRPSKIDKIFDKNNHDICVNISISIPSKLLSNVEKKRYGKQSK